MVFRLLLLSVMVTLPLVSRAQEPLRFDLPMACNQGADCWLFRHVDLDPGPGVRDFGCGKLAGDGHKGVDFAIKDVHVMRQGIPLRAMADGIVTATRDGMVDRDVQAAGYATVRGRDCGNAVVIDHGQGYEAQYCHLRQDSVLVGKGQRVTRGQRIGLIGMSGAASFPHVHITFRKDDRVIDPFSGAFQDTHDGACTPNARSLWTDRAAAALAYENPVIYAHGMTDQRVDAQGIRAGRFRDSNLLPSAPQLSVWSYIAGLEAGDQVELGLEEPGRTSFLTRAFQIEQDADGTVQLAKWHRITKPRPGNGWPAGVYQGRIRVLGPDGAEKAVAFPRLTID